VVSEYCRSEEPDHELVGTIEASLFGDPSMPKSVTVNPGGKK